MLVSSEVELEPGSQLQNHLTKPCSQYLCLSLPSSLSLFPFLSLPTPFWLSHFLFFFLSLCPSSLCVSVFLSFSSLSFSFLSFSSLCLSSFSLYSSERTEGHDHLSSVYFSSSDLLLERPLSPVRSQVSSAHRQGSGDPMGRGGSPEPQRHLLRCSYGPLHFRDGKRRKLTHSGDSLPNTLFQVT